MSLLKRVRSYKRWNEFQDQTYISIRNRYIYMAIGKVASSTIKNGLFQVEYEPVKREPLTLFDKRASPLLSPFQLGDDGFEHAISSVEYFKFSIVRNPYARLLSCYLDRISTKSSAASREFLRYLRRRGELKRGVSFAQFIRTICDQEPAEMNAHWRIQYDDILYPEIRFDFVGHFESLWKDLGYISQRIWGNVRPQFEPTEKSSSPRQTGASARIAEFYNEELSALVYDRYEKDFVTFGYDRSLDAVLEAPNVPDKYRRAAQ